MESVRPPQSSENVCCAVGMRCRVSMRRHGRITKAAGSCARFWMLEPRNIRRRTSTYDEGIPGEASKIAKGMDKGSSERKSVISDQPLRRMDVEVESPEPFDPVFRREGGERRGQNVTRICGLFIVAVEIERAFHPVFVVDRGVGSLSRYGAYWAGLACWPWAVGVRR